MALYKGMLFPLIGVGAQVSVQFGIVETLKKILKEKYADAEGNLAPKYSFLCGVISGVPSALIVVPDRSSRLLSTMQGSKSPSQRRKEKDPSVWPKTSIDSMGFENSTWVSTQLH